MITEQTTIVASKNLVAADLQDEKVILHLTSGVYFGVDAIGSRIWQLLQSPTSVNAICEALMSEYEVSPEQCTADVLAHVNELIVHELVVVAE
jgi:hypothetical protein